MNYSMAQITKLVLLLAVTTASAVTPVEKVISLLDGLKSNIEKEAMAEAATYDKFACFCKDTTMKKAKSITSGQDKIDTLSAAIADNTATKAADETKAQGLMNAKENLSKDLEENTVRCAKEKAEYETLAADFTKAISSLKSAIKSMDDKKKAAGNVKASAALLEVDTGVRKTLELADAMGLIAAPKQKSISAFLQQSSGVDPKDAGYTYHSSDIVDLLLSLKKDFTGEKETLDTEYGKTEAACTNIKASLAGKLATNKNEKGSVDSKISKMGTTISDDRGSLVEAQDLMKDDESYLKELTSRCESRAEDWDQRSSMRSGEIEAISTALKVLGEKVKPADAAVNQRALLQQPTKQIDSLKKKVDAIKETGVTPKKAETKKVEPEIKKVVAVKTTEPAATKKVVAPKALVSFLQRAVVNAYSHDSSNQEARQQLMKEQAIATLRDEGTRLASPVLSALAMRIAADPFKKVKDLIQGLIERLITEAAAEATKKGFCDTEMGKATRTRTFRWNQVQKLTAEVAVLAARIDSLTEDIASLTKAIDTLTTALNEATTLRKEEKAQNAQTLATANEGLEAVNEALLILRSFYKEAAKASSFLQASPVDEDTSGAGFSGAYKGQQQSSNAILSLLQTIASDFERTVRSTESTEEKSARDYVKFHRISSADIAGKTTKKELNEQDLKTTQNTLNTDRADLKNNMDLVDDAVVALMDLRPTCVDTGMSYSERVAKREEEVGALNKALCLLDTEKVEDACK